MATTDIERLVVSLEASITKFERTMAKSVAVSNSTTKKIEDRFKATYGRLEASSRGLAATLGSAFASAAALRGAQQLIDASIRIRNSLKVAGLSGEALTAVYDRLFAAAQKNAAPLESLVELYGKASLVQKELGISTEQLLGFTENVGVALRVSGKSAEESSGALLQLSQLLGSGTVRAEEFNSVQEGALPILQAVAAGLKEAGGSVAKLRALVIAGKLSSTDFFRAFEAGAPILGVKVADATFTVSQRFENLKTALIDAAGKFDTATGASGRAGDGLQKLAEKVQQLGNFFEQNAGKIGPTISFISRLSEVINSVPGVNPLVSLSNAADQLGGSADDASKAFSSAADAADKAGKDGQAAIDSVNAALADSQTAIDAWSSRWSTALPPELFAAIAQIIADLETNKATAIEAAQAITDLGFANPQFADAFESIARLLDSFATLRGEAASTASAISGLGGGASIVAPTEKETRGEQALARKLLQVNPVGLDNPPKPTGGTGKSASEKFSDSLSEQKRRTADLVAETALQRTLNPLINDYGAALEKLRIQQQLENEATKAGLELTPDRKKAIADLAQGYADATVEAAKLSEAQDEARQSMEDWFAAGRDMARGFINDLIDGKSAAEALGGAFEKLGSRLLDLGLDSLFGTGSGSNPFGIIGKALGFADGGYTGPGDKNQPAGVVHKGEVVWSKRDVARAGGPGAAEAMRKLAGYADGGVVGMRAAMTLPRLPAQQAGGPSLSFPFAPVISMPGATSGAVELMGKTLAKQQAEFEGRVKQIVRTQGRKWK